MKKTILFLLIILKTITMNSQTNSVSKTSQTYNHSLEFDINKTKSILIYLEKKLGKCEESVKNEERWFKIDLIQTDDDEILIALKNGVINIDYKNKKKALQKDILIKLKKVSKDIDKIIEE
jgi:hypothetical protein